MSGYFTVDGARGNFSGPLQSRGFLLGTTKKFMAISPIVLEYFSLGQSGGQTFLEPKNVTSYAESKGSGSHPSSHLASNGQFGPNNSPNLHVVLTAGANRSTLQKPTAYTNSDVEQYSLLTQVHKLQYSILSYHYLGHW